MSDSRKTTNPTKYLQLAKELAMQGCSLFSLDEARKIAEESQLEIKDMKGALLSLKSQGWIHSLKRGL